MSEISEIDGARSTKSPGFATVPPRVAEQPPASSRVQVDPQYWRQRPGDVPLVVRLDR